METYQNREDRQTVPLTSDLVFKYVFGGEHSSRYLRSLLSAIQEDAGYPAIAAVEAQSTNHQAFGSRVLYYWAKTYSAQLREGDFYTTLKPVVGMNLLDFSLFSPELGAPLHTTFVPSCVQKPTLPPLPDMVLHFLELPQYDRQNAHTSTALERWLYFICRRGRADAMEDPVMKQILEESPDIAEAERRCQEFVADEQLRSRLDARDKFVRTQAQLLHDAKEKGLKQGIEQGREEEREKRRETARRLKAKEMPIAEIAAVTDLPEEEIQGL